MTGSIFVFVLSTHHATLWAEPFYRILYAYKFSLNLKALFVCTLTETFSSLLLREATLVPCFLCSSTGALQIYGVIRSIEHIGVP